MDKEALRDAYKAGLLMGANHADHVHGAWAGDFETWHNTYTDQPPVAPQPQEHKPTFENVITAPAAEDNARDSAGDAQV